MIGTRTIIRLTPLLRREFNSVCYSYWGLLLIPITVAAGYTPTYVGWDALGQRITLGYIITASYIPPLAAVLFTYRTIHSEIKQRTIVVLLSLPVKRTEVVVSKLLGRSMAVCVLATVSYTILGLIGTYRHGLFDGLRAVGIVLSSFMLIFAFSTIGIAISSQLEDSKILSATAFAVCFFAWGRALWNKTVKAVYQSLPVIGGASPPLAQIGTRAVPGTPHTELFFLRRLHPYGSYNVLTNWALGLANSDGAYQQLLVERSSTAEAPVYVVDTAFSTTVPFYLSKPFSIVILLFWIAIPLLIALFGVNRGDVI